MFQYNKIRGHFGLSRPVLAILAMIVVLIALTGVSLWRTATEANRIDSERTAHALRNAVMSEAAELLAIAGDNANWDDAAIALYDNIGVRDFVADNYVDTTANGELYDGVVAVRRTGQIVFNLKNGALSSVSPRQWLGPEFDRLVASAAADGQTHALLRSADGIRLVGLALVQPTTPTLLTAHRARNREPIYVLFTRPLSRANVAEIGETLIIEQLEPGAAGGADGALLLNDNGTDVTTLHDIAGNDIGTLRWRPTLPGSSAVARSLPFMLVALLAAFIACALLLRRSYASVAEINRIALLDALSELPNRRALRRLTQRVLSTEADVALAFVDLDGFKLVNDLYGHGVGDQLIVQCASFIAGIAPNPGSTARLGGDEFAILAHGDGAKERLIASVEALLMRMREPFEIGDRTIGVGASIGLSCRGTAGESASELMRQADVAMYVAKRSGKMCWHWFDFSHDQKRTEALDIETQLRTALDRDELNVVYQPLIDARTGVISGFEALLRWENEKGLAIGPEQFIPIAEDTGLIDRIGQFVLRRACMDAQDWGDMMVSVNVSAAQLRNPNFPQTIAATLAQTNFPAARLTLEITETYVVSDPVLAGSALDAIRALGVRLALDDFGTGYASIGFLRRFAFDTLKIDRTLVAESMTDEGARAMLHSSIAVARALGMTTVAEGIESEAQAVVMRAAGCDMLQGWHFAREAGAAQSATLIDQSPAPLQASSSGRPPPLLSATSAAPNQPLRHAVSDH